MGFVFSITKVKLDSKDLVLANTLQIRSNPLKRGKYCTFTEMLKEACEGQGKQSVKQKGNACSRRRK